MKDMTAMASRWNAGITENAFKRNNVHDTGATPTDARGTNFEMTIAGMGAALDAS
jgi:hypothetical protein